MFFNLTVNVGGGDVRLASALGCDSCPIW